MTTLSASYAVPMLALALLPVSPGRAAETPKPGQARDCFVYVGTYSGGKSKGIYVCRLDSATGKLTTPELAAEAQNPTFLAVHPQLPALYSAERPVLLAANEVGGGGRSGTVSAYAIDRASGKLTFLNKESSRGAGPCHLSVDRSGRCALVANYGSGSVAVLPLGADGTLGEATAFVQHTGSSVNKQRQEGPHAHWIDVDAANRFAFVCDLGLDQVLIYRFDAASGKLSANAPPFASVKAGSGPRHLAFHPNGRFAYLINEMGNTVTAFAYDAERGALKELQTLPTLPAEFDGRNTTAEIEVHPSGKFLYGSNRGHHSLAVFAVDPDRGRLTPVEHKSTGGNTPRNFAIDPTGQWLLAANQDSDNVVVFALDRQTGRLSPTGQSVEVGRAVCVKFVPMK